MSMIERMKAIAFCRAAASASVRCRQAHPAGAGAHRRGEGQAVVIEEFAERFGSIASGPGGKTFDGVEAHFAPSGTPPAGRARRRTGRPAPLPPG
ncbi:MAG: hypothetical protein U0736_27205 [Gemmataceae bacterium]